MNSTVEKLEPNKVKIEATVDAKKFEEGMQASYLKNVRRFNVPGFRKGKAPRRIIENYYGESVFYEDAINVVCPEAYSEAVKEHSLKPVDRPEIDIKQIGNGKDLIFTATVIVKPEVVLGEYKGLEINKIEYNVTDEQVNDELKKAQDRGARWVDANDRPVEKGDLVTIDYKGFVDGKQFNGGTAENQPLEIGSGHFIPGFEDQVIGMKSAEKRDIKVTFPENYTDELKGKDATFEVTVKEIKSKEVPELDDEFAKDVSEFDKLEDYKNDIKKKLEESEKSRAKYEMEENVISKASANAKIEIPEIMVEHEVDEMVRDFSINLSYQGLTLEKYLTYINSSEEDFRAKYKEDAAKKVRSRLIIEKIGEVENITADQESIDNELKKMADQYKVDCEKLKKDLSDEQMDYVKENIIAEKTIDFLMENSIVK